MSNPIISLQTDDRITRVFAAKLAEVNAVEDKLGKLFSAMTGAQKNLQMVENAARTGQGPWEPVGLATVVFKQREHEHAKLQETLGKLNNELGQMRKAFHAEAERAALAAIA
jgi:hypothetical protein